MLLSLILGLILIAMVAYLGVALLNRFESLETQVADLGRRAAEATERSEQALGRAEKAEESALEAARGRAQAETDAARKIPARKERTGFDTRYLNRACRQPAKQRFEVMQLSLRRLS